MSMSKITTPTTSKTSTSATFGTSGTSGTKDPLANLGKLTKGSARMSGTYFQGPDAAAVLKAMGE